MTKILGVDYGLRRLGVAISDERWKIALPLTTIDRNDIDFISALRRIITEHNVCRIVIGLPIALSGDESKMSIIARKFAEDVYQLGVEVVFQDERLTSTEARKTILSFGEKPSRRKADVDRIAATLILQTYLDSIAIEHNASKTNT